jgi:hypothetical protein
MKTCTEFLVIFTMGKTWHNSANTLGTFHGNVRKQTPRRNKKFWEASYKEYFFQIFQTIRIYNHTRGIYEFFKKHVCVYIYMNW